MTAEKNSKYHFIGIGGIGMSALARIMLKRNFTVSGSDISSSAVTAALLQEGADVKIGHSADHITEDMVVIYSTDIKVDNPEYAAAKKFSCKLMHRSEILQELAATKRSLAVAGTHGKTTTTSLLTWTLQSAGLAPTFVVGGIIPQLTSNGGDGEGQYFVFEACESDRSFINYHPYGAIVTNIDFDHMEHYSSREDHLNVFKTFMSQVTEKNSLFWCGDDPHLAEISDEGVSYGFNDGNEWKISSYKQQGWKVRFDVEHQGKHYREIEASLIGKHNVLNATAVFGLCLSLGIPEQAIRKALSTFGGVQRRCEFKGDTNAIAFYDDYGHHPTEIHTTIKGLRNAIGNKRLVVVYQPHRYSRAKNCIGLYHGIFSEVDELFITEIYSAGEQPIEGVTAEIIADEVKRELHDRCHLVKRDQAANILIDFLKSGDVCLTLGAGNITKLAQEITEKFALKAACK